MFTEEQYVERSGIHCPVCGSDNLVAGPLESEGGLAFQNVDCRGCNSHWTDVYKLVGYSSLETE